LQRQRGINAGMDKKISAQVDFQQNFKKIKIVSLSQVIKEHARHQLE
jgi:hypothetical protein